MNLRSMLLAHRARRLCRDAGLGPDAAADHRRAHPLQPGRLVHAAAAGGHQGAEAGRAQEGVRLQLQRRRHADALEGGARPDRAGAAPLPQPRRDRNVDQGREHHRPRRGAAQSQHLRRHRRVPRLRRRCRHGRDAAHGGAGEGAQDLPACPLRRRRGGAHVQAEPGGPGAVGAFGLRAGRQGARHGDQVQDAVGRPGVPQRPSAVGQARRHVEAAVRRLPRPLHGRHRHLYARALALRGRARQLLAQVAQRAAGRSRRQHRLPQCRAAGGTDAWGNERREGQARAVRDMPCWNEASASAGAARGPRSPSCRRRVFDTTGGELRSLYCWRRPRPLDCDLVRRRTQPPARCRRGSARLSTAEAEIAYRWEPERAQGRAVLRGRGDRLPRAGGRSGARDRPRRADAGARPRHELPPDRHVDGAGPIPSRGPDAAHGRHVAADVRPRAGRHSARA